MRRSSASALDEVCFVARRVSRQAGRDGLGGLWTESSGEETQSLSRCPMRRPRPSQRSILGRSGSRTDGSRREDEPGADGRSLLWTVRGDAELQRAAISFGSARAIKFLRKRHSNINGIGSVRSASLPKPTTVSTHIVLAVHGSDWSTTCESNSAIEYLACYFANLQNID